MTGLDAAKTAGIVLLAGLLQVSIVTPIEVASGHPDLVLVLVVAIALIRGPMLGSLAGFWGGLVVDVAALQALGLTSLVLTFVGYWAGRFGEATTRRSPHPPLVAVAVASVLGVLATGLLHFMLGQGAPVSLVLGQVLLPTLALNMLLAYPVYRLALRLFPLTPRQSREVAVV